MRRLHLAAATLALAAAVPPATALPPGPLDTGVMSKNVKLVASIPEMATAISVNFIGTTMFVSTETGLFSYDVADPAKPALLGALPQYIWENEDMDVDPERKLVFISRDPRGFAGPAGASFPYGMVQIVDVSNPRAMVQKSQILLPGGHTTTCVDKCRYLWTGGPAKGVNQPAEWGGRPIFATDLRDPANPVACPDPIDTGRNDGKTDYAHDVQVDRKGIAWVSGRGGVRGYWTSGKHRNPVTRKTETADGCHPIPYGGGGVDEDNTPSRFMHNSWRRGDVLYATEENITGSCESAGRFATYDLKSAYGGQGWRNPDFRMKALSTWSLEDQPGSTGCASAHYFADRGDGIFANAFYGQGVRFLDVTNPRKVRQVGYYRMDDASAWAAYWHKGYVFVADNARGIDVLSFQGKPGDKPATAPRLRRDATPLRFAPSPVWGWACPVPR